MKSQCLSKTLLQLIFQKKFYAVKSTDFIKSKIWIKHNPENWKSFFLTLIISATNEQIISYWNPNLKNNSQIISVILNWIITFFILTFFSIKSFLHSQWIVNWFIPMKDLDIRFKGFFLKKFLVWNICISFILSKLWYFTYDNLL